MAERPVSIPRLGMIAMQGSKLTKCGPSILAQESGNIVGNTLGANKDENLVLLVIHDLLKVLNHTVALLHVTDNLNNLGDAVVGSQLHGTNVDLDKVMEKVRCHGTDLFRPCSRPHQSLTVGTNLLNDLANLRLETHVQHAISLVENKIGDSAEIGLASLEHVNKTAGGGNADLYTAAEVTDLGSLGNTAVNAGVADARRATKLGNFLLNLDCKFTSRGENQDNGAIARSKKRLSVDVNDGGQAVRESLSGTGLGNTDNVTSRESHGPTLGLNSSRGGETLGLDLIHNISREASLIESLNGLGDVTTSDGHLMLVAESIDFSGRSVRNFGALLVKGLLELGESREI